jgi:antitoxin (DNA-binding transcriptional repressor) of toxin-antitoxin stability system
MNPKQMTVGELKARFSEVLKEVEQGHTIEVVYGRAKKTVAMLTPPPKPQKKWRKMGALMHLGPIDIGPDFKMTDEELIGLD